VVYSTRPRGVGQFISSVKVAAVDGGKDFEGEACGRKKGAEQSAAQKAKIYFQQLDPAATAAAVAAAATKVASGAEGAAKSEATDHASGGNYKSALNEFIMKEVGRPLAKDDVSYKSRPMPAGFFIAEIDVSALTTTVKMDGESRATKKEAEQTAAKVALEYLQAQTAAGKRLSLAPSKAGGAAGAEGAGRVAIAPPSAVPRVPGPVTGGAAIGPPQAVPKALPVVGVPAPKKQPIGPST
jgi:hypothetical protein